VLTGGGGADQFVYKAAPWSAGKITDFALGSDKLDFSALFQSTGYAGSDPVADGRMKFESDGAGGTRIYFDKDAPNSGDWPFLITTLEKVAPAGLTWAQLSGGGTSTPPPAAQKTISLGSNVSLAEGNTGSTAFSFTVTRGGDLSAPASAGWAVTGSGTNAAAASDFAGGTLPTGTVSFAAGESSKTIVVNVAGDAAVEPNETFTVTLSNPSGGTLGTATAVGTITNDDATQGGSSGQTIASSKYGDVLAGGAGADTLIAGQGPDTLTGAGGADRFVFKAVPWNAGKITDFTPGTDKLDLSALFDQTTYAGNNPVQDGYLKLEADGMGGTKVLFDADAAGTGQQWPYLITTLEKVAPSAVQASDWII
jgi:Ca2+-binding RTX toxin-like protein